LCGHACTRGINNVAASRSPLLARRAFLRNSALLRQRDARDHRAVPLAWLWARTLRLNGASRSVRGAA